MSFTHEILRPIAQVYDPSSRNGAPLASVLASLPEASNSAAFSAACNSRNIWNALPGAKAYSAFDAHKEGHNLAHTGKVPSEVSESSNPHVVAPTMGTAEDSSGFSQRPQKQDSEVAQTRGPNGLKSEQDTSSNDAYANSALLSIEMIQHPLSQDAKKKRRQEINRESARRVRKRKTEAQTQLREDVVALKVAVSSTVADQAVLAAYAAGITKERDSLLERVGCVESKWIAAECRNVMLRQRIALLEGVNLQQIAADTGLIASPKTPADSRLGLASLEQ